VTACKFENSPIKEGMKGRFNHYYASTITPWSSVTLSKGLLYNSVTMQTVRIPNRYRKQLFRLNDKKRLWVFDSLLKLSLGENIEIIDDTEGDILELIWRDSVQMAKKSRDCNLSDNGSLVSGSCATMSATYSPTEGNGNEVKGKERKGKEKKVIHTESKSGDLEEIFNYWNGTDEEKTLIPTNRKNNPTCLVGKSIMMECRSISQNIKDVHKKLKGYKKEDVIHGITQYAIEIVNRKDDRDTSDYCSHRMSLYEFLNQSNGFRRFVEHNKSI